MKKFKRADAGDLVVTLSSTAISALAQDHDPYSDQATAPDQSEAPDHSSRANHHARTGQIRMIPREERRACSTCRDQFRSSRVGLKIGLQKFESSADDCR